MPQFVGFVDQEANLYTVFLTRSGNQPLDAASLPAYRVYGPQGLMSGGTGSAALRDSGTITGATNASPIVVSCAGHGLSTGSLVTISGVLGNTAANGTFVVTNVSSGTFSLNGSTGNGAYTSGGTWHVTGLYGITLLASASAGYASGNVYSILVNATVNSVAWGDVYSFAVT